VARSILSGSRADWLINSVQRTQLEINVSWYMNPSGCVQRTKKHSWWHLLQSNSLTSRCFSGVHRHNLTGTGRNPHTRFSSTLRKHVDDLLTGDIIIIIMFICSKINGNQPAIVYTATSPLVLPSGELDKTMSYESSWTVVSKLNDFMR